MVTCAVRLAQSFPDELMISSSSSNSPASMKRFAATLSGEPAVTAVRSMSPVGICGMPNLSLMKFA